MAILLTRMKIFSPFVNAKFTLKPRIVALIFFIACLCINTPLFFSAKVSSLGTYPVELNQTNTLYFCTSSDFSTTSIGQFFFGIIVFLNQFLTLVIGLILNIVSVLQYKSYLRERSQREEAYRRVAFSNNNNHGEVASIEVVSQRPDRQLTPREKKDRKVEKNMFYMALTLSTISTVSRILFMISYVFYFFFNSFSYTLILIFNSYSIQTLVPSSGIFVFYSFNKMFRQEFKKRISSKIKPNTTQE